MDNMETAKKQMEIIADMLDQEERMTYLKGLIGIAQFYVLFDIAESLHDLATINENLDILTGLAMEDK